MKLGLDELIIVNPGEPPASSWFLGDDGGIYRVDAGTNSSEPGLGAVEPVPRYFLGEDGTLYETT
jgi:hypothetical protein